MKLLERNNTDIKNPFAIISPHAGYIFSGDVAATIFNTIDPNRKYDNVFILSTSHTSNYRGAAILPFNVYQTPYGNMNINVDISSKLSENGFIKPNINYFLNDHTIEVILPFIQNKINYKYIVPIMIGDTNPNTLKEISKILKEYLTDDNLFIISSDFSHYPSYDEAIRIDNETKDLIINHNSDKFLKNMYNEIGYNNMCGWSSYLVLLYMIENDDIDINVIKYKNSGDTIYGGKDRVVGYFGITFNRK